MTLKYAVGVDIGGTNIKAAVVNVKGNLVTAPVTEPTQAAKETGIIVDNVAETIERVIRKKNIKKSDLAGIGLGVPTTFDEKGLLLPSTNLPTLTGKDPAALLGTRFPGIELKKENDANCFVLGETKFGTLKGHDYSCGITLGTGLGVGLLLRGRLYRGSRGGAGELFRSPYKEESLESVLSGPGISRMYRDLTDINLDAKEIAEEARKGNQEAIETWERFGHTLGYALSYITNLLDIDAVAIGGGLSGAQDLFIERTKLALQKYTAKGKQPEVLRTQCGRAAGIVGAAALFFV